MAVVYARRNVLWGGVLCDVQGEHVHCMGKKRGFITWFIWKFISDSVTLSLYVSLPLFEFAFHIGAQAFLRSTVNKSKLSILLFSEGAEGTFRFNVRQSRHLYKLSQCYSKCVACTPYSHKKEATVLNYENDIDKIVSIRVPWKRRKILYNIWCKGCSWMMSSICVRWPLMDCEPKMTSSFWCGIVGFAKRWHLLTGGWGGKVGQKLTLADLGVAYSFSQRWHHLLTYIL